MPKAPARHRARRAGQAAAGPSSRWVVTSTASEPPGKVMNRPAGPAPAKLRSSRTVRKYPVGTAVRHREQSARRQGSTPDALRPRPDVEHGSAPSFGRPTRPPRPPAPHSPTARGSGGRHNPAATARYPATAARAAPQGRQPAAAVLAYASGKSRRRQKTRSGTPRPPSTPRACRAPARNPRARRPSCSGRPVNNPPRSGPTHRITARNPCVNATRAASSKERPDHHRRLTSRDTAEARPVTRLDQPPRPIYPDYRDERQRQ